ncbi:four-carbon acid sugar kinase family protein [Nocardioides seonyuensis]|uniref:Four-carbon acid sugar kinase family protein n=1 Tax=Nocardioides seonyuensis TaxID=2518371 RepID=A0A4P7IFP2_9ACTN|nr:four-carbon acid sugar kinase family protein [Nocardioides seonyuensis]QBX56094.1 four-carbon acid sugar kinase family protein [Nocardioides seonyuensis]
MADVLVVADDLTGANAAAAGFARAGFRAVTASAGERAEVVAEMVSRFDVVVATTDSRHLEPARARERVGRVVRAGWPARLVCNRIDTTLRGNVGATTREVLDRVAELTGSRVVALCAPAHPGANRQTIGGMQLLDGRRLEDTEVARDARTPIHTSDVVALLREQADLEVVAVPLDAVTGDLDALAETIRQHLDAGAEVIVADATTVEHLDRLAAAAVAATAGTETVWTTTDPGPASVALAAALGLAESDRGAPLLALSGSATELTQLQLRQLVAERGARPLRTAGRHAVPDVDATVRMLDDALAEADPGDIVVLATVLDDSDLWSPSSEEAARIPVALARAARRALESRPVDGVFTTGGDVTAALLAELGSHGLEISDEVVPLAVAGSLVGGPWDGLQIVTKGGLVGDARTTIECLDHLRGQVEAHRRQVTAAESRERT